MNSRWDKTSTPQVSRIMDEMMANHNAMRMERAMWMSQQSATSRPVTRGKTGSFMEKVGGYIKPTRPKSFYSQSTAYHSFLDGDDRSSVRRNVFDGPERLQNR